jgi:hypothetical protein
MLKEWRETGKKKEEERKKRAWEMKMAGISLDLHRLVARTRPVGHVGHEVLDGLEVAVLQHARVVVAARQGLPDLCGCRGEFV